jgi:hypothetical protein
MSSGGFVTVGEGDGDARTVGALVGEDVKGIGSSRIDF